jgi:RHS repeat-associated protein
MALTRNYSQRNSSWNAPYTFSGKEKDVETGYGYFGARYYDSGLSIWLSVDPMSDKYPSMSPYNYCANNPVMLVDPDGREVFDSFIYNSKNKTLIGAYEAFVNTTMGTHLIGLFAKKGQTIAGVHFDSDEMYHKAGIDLTFKFDASFHDSTGGTTENEVNNNRLNNIVTINPNLSLYKIVKNITHEIVVHAMQNATDFYKDRNIDCSHAPSNLKDAASEYKEQGYSFSYTGYVHHYNERRNIGNLLRFGIPVLTEISEKYKLKKTESQITEDLYNFENK